VSVRARPKVPSRTKAAAIVAEAIRAVLRDNLDEFDPDQAAALDQAAARLEDQALGLTDQVDHEPRHTPSRQEIKR